MWQERVRWTSSLVAVCIAISVAVAVLWLLQEGSEGTLGPDFISQILTAAATGDAAMSKLLLEGADVNFQNHVTTPLKRPSMNGCVCVGRTDGADVTGSGA